MTTFWSIWEKNTGEALISRHKKNIQQKYAIHFRNLFESELKKKLFEANGKDITLQLTTAAARIKDYCIEVQNFWLLLGESS